MVRIIGFLVGLFFAVMALWAFGTGLGTVASQGYLKEKTAESVFHREPKHLALASDGPFGKFDHRQVQRGYQVYKEVCKACHSLNQVAFRDLAELGYDDAEVKAEAASWTVPGIDPSTGETTTRPGVPTDYFPKPFANDIAARAANSGAIPPDLSLMAKAREGGPAYIYSVLTGFQPVPAELKKQFPDFQSPSGTYFNPYFANLNIKMPPPLTSDGQVQFKDGTPATVDEMAKDVAAFLMWTAEPSLDKR
ncbi:MAG: cytochrome c1, partial [Croceibacterium sp.]